MTIKKIIRRVQTKRLVVAPLVVILIGGIGVGVWQFSKHYNISRKTTISQLNKDVENLKKQAEEQQIKIIQLEADKKSLEDKITYMEENPKVITKTVSAPTPKPTLNLPPPNTPAPSWNLPKHSTCSWVLGNWNCWEF